MAEQKQIQEKIQELQILEHNLQNFMAQRQAIQVELNETANALQELEKSPEEVYKITSGIMLKSSSEDLKKEIGEKNKLLNLRISALEKQENSIERRASNLREEINEFVEAQSKKKK